MARPRVITVTYHPRTAAWRVYAARRDMKNGVGHLAARDRKPEAVKLARDSIVEGEIAILRILHRDGGVQTEKKYGY